MGAEREMRPRIYFVFNDHHDCIAICRYKRQADAVIKDFTKEGFYHCYEDSGTIEWCESQGLTRPENWAIPEKGQKILRLD